MNKLREKFKSIRVRLFATISFAIIIVVLLLLLINSILLESFYSYNKRKSIINIYEQINSYYNNANNDNDFEEELKFKALKNNLEILIKTDTEVITLTRDPGQVELFNKVNVFNEMDKKSTKEEILYQKNNVVVKKSLYVKKNTTYLILLAKLDNGNELFIRTPTAAIKESVRVSNNALIIIGGISIVIAAMFASILAKRFTKPIVELNVIAEKMSNLDFSQKYNSDGSEDEIDNLGKSINAMSEKLEGTIKQLKIYNSELEKDIEKRSKIDEMRKQFISDVSHELKTPISLIQGYAEGLLEDVNTDDESRKYYSEVILDESNKMDKLVKQLLELMKLEYDNRLFNNSIFDITGLIKEVIRKYNIIILENNIKVEFDFNNRINVNSDDFYIEQVVTNYITNAIRYSKPVKDKRIIRIKVRENKNKVRVCVFNTGENIAEEELEKIWGRFYKVDTSRNRENGGTGIGLSYVKAVMNNYQNDYGVENKESGVEFYFDLDKI